MDTSVDTRRGVIVTAIKNHLLSAVLWFLLNGFVFAWLVTGWKYGSIFLGLIAVIFYMSGIYSYAYEQPKLDMIIKKRYDYLMPLKIGGASGLIIFILSGSHFLLRLINEEISMYYGMFVRFLNFPFVYFFHGYDGLSYNFGAVIIMSLIPILVAYFAYFMSSKGYSLTQVHDRIVYEKKDNK